MESALNKKNLPDKIYYVKLDLIKNLLIRQAGHRLQTFKEDSWPSLRLVYHYIDCLFQKKYKIIAWQN